MIDFVWSEAAAPAGVPVRQVHGWLVDRAGRVMLQDRHHEDRFLLAGGKIEPCDRGDWRAALLREALEESQVRVDLESIRYLGHQVVTGDPGVGHPYVQVRMFGMITEFRPSAPDPDSGHTYGRLLTSFKRAADLLDWGRPGELQAAAAARASRELGLPASPPLGSVR